MLKASKQKIKTGMIIKVSLILMIIPVLLFLGSCGGEKPDEEPPKEEKQEEQRKAEPVISDVKVLQNGKEKEGGKVKIHVDEDKNDVRISFVISEYTGHEVAFVDKDGLVLKRIDVFEYMQEMAEVPKSDQEKYHEDVAKVKSGEIAKDVEVTTALPNKKWMDRKRSVYRIKSLYSARAEESEEVKVVVKLKDQYKYFNEPVEGSAVWYGGGGKTTKDRCGVILATDKRYFYCVGRSRKKDKIYKWAKSDCMINLPDVRSDIVYDIYNAYNSRFFPIEGRAMYSDNGAVGLGRYEYIEKEDAVHKNRKTGKRTFMAPAQWDFAKVIAKAQVKAREQGVTLYVVDTFRPMGSVGPVATAVDDPGLLTYGGSSAHNFGLAVDTGWQHVDEKGEPEGDPLVTNLQALDRKAAVQGPNGNNHESWWSGVPKLQQEWWHYGASTLAAAYKPHAKRVEALYVNLEGCPSVKRSRL